MILLDTSGLLAAIDGSQEDHAAAAVALTAARPPLILSPFVLAELDYMVGKHAGQAARDALLDQVASGVYSLERFSAADVAMAQEVMAQYADLDIGLADASIVVLAARNGSQAVLTLDHRHFRALRTRDGKMFRLLPADDHE